MPRFLKIRLMALPALLALVAVPAIALSATPAAATPAATAAPATAIQAAPADTAVRASTDDFTFASFDADYYLGRDAEQHSTLRTVEHLVAVFPAIDQNRGIRRVIPNHYNGHPTGLTIESITDEHGTPRGYEVETDEDDSNLTIVTIAGDDYVHGEQTYVIEYTQRYVTMVPDDATPMTANEFYWDVNGTGWAQPFGAVNAAVHVDPDLVQHLTGAVACYQGGYGSGEACDRLQTEADDTGSVTVRAQADGLRPYENLTVAIGFEADTFVPRDDAYLATGTGYGQLAGLGAAIAVLLTALVFRMTRWRDHPGRGTIVPEYLPPKGVNPLVASDLHGKPASQTAAAFLELAVRHHARVIEEAPKSKLGGKPRYVLELVQVQGLDGEMRRLAVALFGSSLTPGARRDLSKADRGLGQEIVKIRAAAKKRSLTAGYRRTPTGHRRALLGWLGAAAAVVAGLFGVLTAADELGDALPFLLLVVTAVVFVVTLATVGNVRPMTERGAALRDYLRGMEMYIKLAEADRLRYLQSPQGALRTEYAAVGAPAPAAEPGGTAVLETGQIVKLYEKLLPYAVLFGLEKDWARQLGEYYARDNTQPDWYEGSGAFNAGYFAASIGTLTSTASSNWSGSSSSSSSSGSGGGGHSGGGGGGGGGGGV